MMSKKKWAVLLFFYIIFLLLGATMFHNIEVKEEIRLRVEEKKYRDEISVLIDDFYLPNNKSAQEYFIKQLGEYCEKPMSPYTDKDDMRPFTWDFYHAFFFSFTVSSTVGYGNLAPTVMPSRMIMIFYALVGIPIHAILLAHLGEYFGTTFIKMYQKWKSHKKNYNEKWKLGLFGQVFVYILFGFCFFIFIPAVIISYFEDWEYDVAVYYSFVTLTTVGFGDIVAGMHENGHGQTLYLVYKIWLIVWILFGLGYIFMIFGFINRGIRSQKMRRMEKTLAEKIKSTPQKVWQGFTKDIGYLRKVLNELYMMKFQPVYRDETQYAASYLERRWQSCPDFEIYRTESPTLLRRRAFSESINSIEHGLCRVQSDSDLSRIDRNATFAANTVVQPTELLAHVVNALGSITSEEDIPRALCGVQGFSDSQILSSETWNGSQWTLNERSYTPTRTRNRACSEVMPEPIMNYNENSGDWTWSGPTKEIQEFRMRHKQKASTLPPIASGIVMDSEVTSQEPAVSLQFQKPFLRSKKPDDPDGRNSVNSDMISQQYRTVNSEGRRSFCRRPSENSQHMTYPLNRHKSSSLSVPEASALEETTVGDLLRAISSLNTRMASINENTIKPRKMGTASLTPPALPPIMTLFPPPPPPMPPLARRSSLRPGSCRRMSLRPAANSGRRFSVRPVILPPYDNGNDSVPCISPPPYSVVDSRKPSVSISQPRRASMIPESSAVARFASKWRLNAIRSECNAQTRTRHDSLNDLRIDRT